MVGSVGAKSAKSGTKRFWLVEGSSVPVGLAVAGANKNDFKLLTKTTRSIPVGRRSPQTTCACATSLVA